MGFLALLLMPKCSTDLNYGPCPPARDRVSSLVLRHLASPIGVELFFAMLQAKSGSVHPQLTNAAMLCLLKKQIGEAKTVSQLTII